jgi:transglutaminase-like putative cysteine protease
MTGRRRLGMVAAGATLLAAAPISTIFASWTWLLECILAVGLISGGALLTRTFRFPVWAQVVGEFAGLLLALTWIFPAPHAFLIPTPSTFNHFGELLTQAGQDTRNYGVPVPDRPGLLFTTVLGIGLVAIVVDVLTVVLRRPALAGLPMLAIYSVPVAVYIDSVPVTPFIVGACGYLWLLVSDNIDRVRRFGRRFTGDGRDVDVWEPSPLAAAGRRLGLVGLVAAVLVPLLVPTITGGLLSQLTQNGAGIGQGGLGGGNGGRGFSLFANLSGSLTQTETVSQLRVTTDEPAPFYLRLGIADQLTNNGFSTRAPSGPSLSRGLLDPRTDNNTNGGDFRQYHATVQISDKWQQQQGLLPVYSSPIQLSDIGGGWNYDTSQQTIFSTRNNIKGKKYSFDYLRASYTPDELRSALPLDKDNSLILSFTNTPFDQTVKTQVDKLVRGKTTEYDKVLALYDFFSKKNGFSYSLSTVPVQNASQIAAFLKNRTGYCQQYAAALAWMARVAGFPARVAFGFTKGTATDKTNTTFEMTNRNAHAWTEIYFDGFGWVPFDATPAGDVTGSAPSVWAPDNNAPAASASASSSAGPAGADPSSSVARQNRPDRTFDNAGGAGVGAGAGGFSTTSLLISIALALLIVLLLVPSLRRMLLRRHRHAATVPRQVAARASGPSDIVVTTEAVQAREDAHAAWDELIDTMIDYRIPVDPAETPRVTAHRLIDEAVLIDASASAATLLGTAEEQARYARRPMRGAELPPALRQVRKGLSRSATWRTRFAAAVMPPSVLLRWRLALGDFSARSVGTAGRLREAMARFNPRRFLARSR